MDAIPQEVTNLLQVAAALIQGSAGCLSVLVAVAALYVAIQSERRNQQRFTQDLAQSQAIARGNVRPILHVRSQGYINLKSIKLENRGIGVAIITKIVFSKGDRTTRRVVDLFDLGEKVIWDTFSTLREPHPLAAGSEVTLVQLSEEGLLQNHPDFSQEKARSILAKWQAEKSGIQITAEYQDVLGNHQEPCIETLN